MAYNPFERWMKMDNYWKEYVHTHRCKGKMQQIIEEFQMQYLLRVASIDQEDAILFERDISPWRPNRGDYQRSYSDGNRFLRAIGTEIKSRMGWAEEQIYVLADRILVAEKEIHKEVAEEGLTISLQDAAALAVQLQLGRANTAFALPEMKEGVDNFATHPIFLSFKEDSQRGKGCRAFSASVVVDLLEGFLELDRQKIPRELHRDSMGRVLYFLERAMGCSSSYLGLQKFENYLELVFEEMILWLLFAKPYKKRELEAYLQEALSQKPAFFRTVQSGMAAFREIVEVLREEKTMYYFDDCYFECVSLLKKIWKTAVVVQFPEYDIPAGKVDVLFVDFHTNFVRGKSVSKKHDIAQILSRILPASSSLTVVIDNTIGMLASNEVEHLLQTFAGEIASKKLHVIVFWSHQKFDMFGCDKLSGGSYCVYSRDPAFLARFGKKKMADIDTISRQALTHFFRFGRSKLEERRERIFAGARYVHAQLPVLAGVVTKLDDCIFSVDVAMEATVEKELAVLREFAKRGIPLMTRPSFGFNLATSSLIQWEVMRFSIGIEDREYLDQFIAAFQEILVVLNL